MSNVINFNFNSNSIRVVTIEDQPWFVLAEVALCLGWTAFNAKYHARESLQADQKRVVKLTSNRGAGSLLISESGLYKLVMRSDKPQARAFQDWVTREVLPSIRKTGAYVTGQPSIVENPRWTRWKSSWPRPFHAKSRSDSSAASDRRDTSTASSRCSAFCGPRRHEYLNLSMVSRTCGIH